MSKTRLGAPGAHPEPGRMHCAQAACMEPCRGVHRRRVVGHTGLCHGPPPGRVAGVPYRVAACTRALVRRVVARLPFSLGHDTKVYRNPIPAASIVSCVARTLGRITGRVAARCCLVATLCRCPYCDTTAAPSHDT